MIGHTLESNALEHRRRRLGISRSALAKRSGVSMATVNRVLSGGLDRVTVANVRAIAHAMGAALTLEESTTPQALQEREAREKAKRIVSLVQGNMGLESQAVDPECLSEMVNQTVHELMAGPRRRLWAT